MAREVADDINVCSGDISRCNEVPSGPASSGMGKPSVVSKDESVMTQRLASAESRCCG